MRNVVFCVLVCLAILLPTQHCWALGSKLNYVRGKDITVHIDYKGGNVVLEPKLSEILGATNGFPMTSKTTDFKTDVEEFLMASSNEPLQVFHQRLQFDNANMTGNLLIITNPRNHTFVYPPIPQGCGVRVPLSTSAKERGCRFAINAGFFNMDNGDCIGNLVSENKVFLQWTKPNANFGVRNGHFVTGYVAPNDVTPAFDSLVAGVGWLVRNGKNYLNESVFIESISKSFVDLLAPRIVVGHNKEGHMLILQVDGYHPPETPGFTLHHMAELSLAVGGVNMVNLDGGGSVTLLLDGEILNKCSDSCPGQGGVMCPNGKCLRGITSFICFK